MEILKKLVIPIVPIKFVTKLLLKKFVTKFVDTDLEDAVFDGDTIHMKNIILN